MGLLGGDDGTSTKVAPRTDSNLDDEEAGRMRHVLAERSRARRQETLKKLHDQNSQYFSTMRDTNVRTDDDIMDEAAGRKRIALQAASSSRRAREKEELRQKNFAMKERLKTLPPRFLNIAPDGVQNTLPRSREKSPQDMLRTIEERMNGEERPPSWLHSLERYEWAVPAS